MKEQDTFLSQSHANMQKKILPFVVELTKQGRDCETKETLHFDVK